MTKRLCLLVALLLGFAASGWAETKTDTIQLDIKVSGSSYYSSELVIPNKDIRHSFLYQWVYEDGTSSSQWRPASTTVYPYTRTISKNVQLFIYYTYDDTYDDRYNRFELVMGASENSYDCAIYVRNATVSLKARNCTQLAWVDCRNQALTSIDLSGCSNLRTLDGCSDNRLTSLNLSGCSNLTTLNCSNNQLTSLDLSGCSNLTTLNCSNNQLTSLDLSGCPNLKTLNYNSNRLTGLDLSVCPNLATLYCHDNRLTTIDISKNKKLENLRFYYNHIPLSIVHQIYKSKSWETLGVIGFSQSDAILLCINQPLDLSSEKIIGDSISKYKLLDASGQEISSSSDDFIFQFSTPGLYRLILSNGILTGEVSINSPDIGGPGVNKITLKPEFTWVISVVEAIYSIQLAPNNPDYGSVSISGNGRYAVGTEVTITATPQEGGRFINWTKENGEVFSTEAEYTFTATEDLNLTANFAEMFAVNLSTNNLDYGSVSISGNGRYAAGTEVTITAIPQEGGRFINWTKENGEVFSTEAEYTFTATEDLNLTANFAEMFAVNLSTNNLDYGSVSISGNGRYAVGTEVTIYAYPDNTYRFVNWTKEDGSVFSTEAEYTFIVTEDLELTANFEEIPEKETFTINLSSSNRDWGNVYLSSNNGYSATYEEGTEITINARPYWGYRFVNWTKADGSVFSTEAEYTFVITENLNLTANFEPGGNVGNENREEDNFAVYVQGRTIYLSEPRGRVQVFNVAGQCVYNGSSTVIPAPHSGVYIVKVDTQNYKVVVR